MKLYYMYKIANEIVGLRFKIGMKLSMHNVILFKQQENFLGIFTTNNGQPVHQNWVTIWEKKKIAKIFKPKVELFLNKYNPSLGLFYSTYLLRVQEQFVKINNWGKDFQMSIIEEH